MSGAVFRGIVSTAVSNHCLLGSVRRVASELRLSATLTILVAVFSLMLGAAVSTGAHAQGIAVPYEGALPIPDKHPCMTPELRRQMQKLSDEHELLWQRHFAGKPDVWRLEYREPETLFVRPTTRENPLKVPRITKLVHGKGALWPPLVRISQIEDEFQKLLDKCEGIEEIEPPVLPPSEPPKSPQPIEPMSAPQRNDYIAGAPNGFYLTGTAALVNTNTSLNPFVRVSDAFGDTRDLGSFDASATSVFGGVGGGFNGWVFQRQGGVWVQLGVEGQALWGSGTGTLAGAQVVGIPASATDVTTFRDNRIVMVGGTVTTSFFPSVFPNMSIMGSAGWADVNKTVTHQFNGYADAAGVPRFTQSQNFDISTWYLGLTVQQGVNIGGAPVFLSASFRHIFPSNQTFSFGYPAGVLISNGFNQSINIAQVGVSIPIGETWVFTRSGGVWTRQ